MEEPHGERIGGRVLKDIAEALAQAAIVVTAHEAELVMLKRVVGSLYLAVLAEAVTIALLTWRVLG